MCDLLDGRGKETLEVSVCREASEKTPRAFRAFRRLGYLQASGRAYHRLGMFTAAIKVIVTYLFDGSWIFLFLTVLNSPREERFILGPYVFSVTAHNVRFEVQSSD
ncbi:hypothetical protein RHMOL_Rhmol06G0022300 [Rhododendron molle]|uniref:Uncharacterized protein n=1 Tax=Rhododendron molle TaxID=49168 RepID=A0ACC0N885_RHOML|nr:hypothetical protein RHMOL_Rhmol06G0022300 [Rhododendron molle]